MSGNFYQDNIMDCSKLTQDPRYKYLVEEWKRCTEEKKAATQKEYLAWKKIQEMEEKFLKTRIH